MKRFLNSLHPSVQFLYFFLVIGFSIFVLNPFLLAISLIFALLYSSVCCGKKTVRLFFCTLVPIGLLLTLINPLVNHSGMTVLLYLNDLPITLESLCYGAVTSLMLLSVILWFSCSNRLITSDRLIFLFGNRFPTFCLLFTMILRLVPHLKQQIYEFSLARKGIGLSSEHGNFRQKFREGCSVLSAVSGWSLENSMITADSMNARGYGTAKRTHCASWKITISDILQLIWISVCGIIVFVGIFIGAFQTDYFPIYYCCKTISLVPFLLSFLFLCLFPLIFGGIRSLHFSLQKKLLQRR